MSRFLKVFIAMSILLNLLLAGLVIGNLGRYAMDSHKRYTLQELVNSATGDKRTAFDMAMQSAEQDTGELRQQLSDVRKQANTILKTDPFVKEAYFVQMQRIQQLRAQLAQRVAEAVVALAEQETPAERSALADMLRYSPRPAKEN